MKEKKTITAEEKLRTVKEYFERKSNVKEFSEKYHVATCTFRDWIIKYITFGNLAFEESRNYFNYTTEIKETAVKAYINGEGSIHNIVIKYRIKSPDTLRKWISQYIKQNDVKLAAIPRNKRLPCASYTILFKESVAKAIMKGQPSVREIALQHKAPIPCIKNIQCWISEYKSHEGLKPSEIEKRRR